MASTRSKGLSATSATSSPMSTKISNIIQLHLSEFKESFIELLKTTENRIMERIGDLQAEVSNLKSSVQSLSVKQIATTKKCDSLAHEVEELKLKVDKFEMDAASSDVLLLNIPCNVDASDTFVKLTALLKCSDVKPRKVFRTKQTKQNQKSVPIIAKLSSSSDRSTLLRCLSEFRKSNKRSINLRDLDIEMEDNVSIFECLSSVNREILQSALHFKRNKLLVSTFSLRGFVYVKQTTDGDAVRVRTMEELNRVVGSTN